MSVYNRRLITEDISNIMLFLLKYYKHWNRTLGKVENKQKWLKLILQENKWALKCSLNWYFNLSWIKFLLLFSSDCRMEIERQPIFQFYICVHTIRYLPKGCCKEISDGKLYHVNSSRQYLYILNHWTLSSK
jgi:hypothetical protein